MSVFGDGKQQGNFTYISEVVPIIARSPLVEGACNQVVNLGADQPYTINVLAEEVATAMGVKPQITHLPSRNEVVIAYSDHTRCHEVFGAPIAVSLRDGLSRMAEWVRNVGARKSSSFENIEICRRVAALLAAAMTDSLKDTEIAAELPSLGIMVLNQNGAQWLPSLYESLRRQAYPFLKIYLVDNASTDNSVALTQSNYPDVNVLKLSKNAGYCMAYNRTMPIAFSDGCEWVIWANNDLLLEPGCLLEMSRIAIQTHDVGVIGPAFFAWESDEPNYYIRGKHPAAIEPMQNNSPLPLEVDWVEGSFLMVSQRCVREVGWLDPYLFSYWEEADFCRRATRKKWRVLLAPRAHARHYGGGTSSSSNRIAEASGRLKSRNQYIFTLADPNYPFFRNLFQSMHLFIVLIKVAMNKSLSATRYELGVLLRLIPELGQIWRKWRRDKSGIPPEETTPHYSKITVEVTVCFAMQAGFRVDIPNVGNPHPNLDCRTSPKSARISGTNAEDLKAQDLSSAEYEVIICDDGSPRTSKV